ncbi:TVB79 protein, partial [Atractosteus spatula]|nr:TVB79 protein [Atractosteus spatula]
FPHISILSPSSDMTAADSISSLLTKVSRKEGESVTLRCSYDTSNEYVYLYWYRQYSDQPPQYILRKGARSNSGSAHTADFAKDRFSSTAERTFTTLTISDLTVGDTAVYLCALRAAHCEKDTEEPYKNLSVKNRLCSNDFTWQDSSLCF